MRLSDHSCKFFKSSDVLNSFLADVRRYPVPTIAEEEELFERYRNGDKSAVDGLILGHLRFIYSIAKIYARNESEVSDYVNEGVIGLMKALDDFDPSKGYKFITYGVWYIRRQMNYYMLTKRDMISHSAQVGNITKKSDSFRQKYFAENGRMPTTEEIREALKASFNISVSKDEDMYEPGVSSIDEDIADDYTVGESCEFNDRTASHNEYEDEVEDEYNKEIANKCLSVLSKNTATIIKMRFGIGYDRPFTAEEIADEFGIGVDRVEKICSYAILQMKKVPVKRVI